MTLKNLLELGQLEAHETNRAQVAELLSSIERSLADSKVQAVSEETRFDAAYRAILNAAMLGLWANGFRPSKSVPGHHQTMIQSLVKSVGIDTDEMRLLDAFRVKRNAIDYTGELVDASSLAECIAAADRLRVHVTKWLRANRPDLI